MQSLNYERSAYVQPVVTKYSSPLVKSVVLKIPTTILNNKGALLCSVRQKYCVSTAVRRFLMHRKVCSFCINNVRYEPSLF